MTAYFPLFPLLMTQCQEAAAGGEYDLPCCTDLIVVFAVVLFRDGADGADTDAEDKNFPSILRSGEGQRQGGEHRHGAVSFHFV